MDWLKYLLLYSTKPSLIKNAGRAMMKVKKKAIKKHLKRRFGAKLYHLTP